MPLFDYLCKQCGKQFEWFEHIYDTNIELDRDPKCPCGSYEVVKCPSAPAVRFKGEGWQTPKAEGKD